MGELQKQFLRQSNYDKKININLRNSHALKKSKKKRERSTYKDSRVRPSQFALGAENSVEVTQNFSMVKKKGDGLNYSVLGHSQFVGFDEERGQKESQTSNEPPSHFFPKKRPVDYLDKVFNLEYPSPPRHFHSISTPKYQPDLVEMVKNIFNTRESDNSSYDDRALPSLFKDSPTLLQPSSHSPVNQSKAPVFSFLRPKPEGLKLQLGKPLVNRKRAFGQQIDCSDVMLSIRQRQLYRRPLQLFQRN